ncbi:hypothetical protein Tco_1359978 [Tanacetum coccineum]
MNALKALQPPTTLPAAIPRFEENNGQSFSSVGVEKEGKEIRFLGALVTRSEVADGYGRNWNIVFQYFELLDDRHAKRALQRKVWDPGLARRDILKQHLADKVVFQGTSDDMNRCLVKAMTKINDLEANLEQFKSETLAWQKETSNRFDQMQESIDNNKVDADRQFTELLQLLKALQPPTTLPATIPQFEEKSEESYTSSKVVKDSRFISDDVTKFVDSLREQGEDDWQPPCEPDLQDIQDTPDCCNRKPHMDVT